MIEAKDTIMGKEELAKINSDMPSEAKYGEVFDEIAFRQAEISFKAGIKLVVEWLEQYHIKVLEGDPSDIPAIYSDCGYHVPTHAVQAQVKTWGL